MSEQLNEKALTGGIVTPEQADILAANGSISKEKAEELKAMAQKVGSGVLIDPVQQAQIDQENAAATQELAPETPPANMGQAETVAKEELAVPVKQEQIQSADPSQQLAQESAQNQITELSKAQEAELAAIGAEAEAATEIAANKAALQQELANQSDQRLQLRLQKESAINDRLMQVDKELSKLSEQKIDPDRFINNQSTGSKILSGIAIVLGGAGGGENQALKVIQDAINRDIDGQKQNLVLGRQAARDKLNLVDHFRKSLASDREAEVAAKQALISATQAKIEAITARSANARAVSKGQQLIAKLELEKGKIVDAFRKTGLTTPTMQQVNAQPELVERLPEEMRKRIVRIPGIMNPSSENILLNNAQGADKVKEKVATGSANIEELQKLLDFSENGNRYDPVERSRIASDLLRVAGRLRESILGPGVMNQQEFERLMKVLGDPTSVSNSVLNTSSVKLKSVMEGIKRDVESTLKTNSSTFKGFPTGSKFKSFKRNK